MAVAAAALAVDVTLLGAAETGAAAAGAAATTAAAGAEAAGAGAGGTESRLTTGLGEEGEGGRQRFGDTLSHSPQPFSHFAQLSESSGCKRIC